MKPLRSMGAEMMTSRQEITSNLSFHTVKSTVSPDEIKAFFVSQKRDRPALSGTKRKKERER
jgi:hypothetical protein